MRKYFNQLTILIFVLVAGVYSCKKSTIDTNIEGIGVEDYDIVQLTDEQPDLPVSITLAGNGGIDSVRIKVYPNNSTTVIASQTLTKFTYDELGRLNLSVAFPTSTTAPTGLYKVEYIVYDGKGGSFTKTYFVNVLNVKSNAVTCTGFPTTPLASGKNVRLLVTCPPNTNGEDVYVSGNFESGAGCGGGDWTGGGNACLKLTKLAGSTTCYWIDLALTSSAEFKITRGSWAKVMKGPNGEELDNLKWNGTALQTYKVANWDDRKTFPPVTLPKDVIATGKLTVVADVKSTDDNIKYYLVKKGNPVTDKSIPMVRVPNSTKVAALVPKDQVSEYYVVKDGKKSINSWGFEITGKWDGKSNPIEITTAKFEGDATVAVPNTLYIIGGATPGGWSAPVSAAQTFTKKANGVFEITLALTAGEGYLLFEENTGCCWWQKKVGSGGGKLSGQLVYQGGDFSSPDVSGNYKITVDFTKESYLLVKQ